MKYSLTQQPLKWHTFVMYLDTIYIEHGSLPKVSKFFSPHSVIDIFRRYLGDEVLYVDSKIGPFRYVIAAKYLDIYCEDTLFEEKLTIPGSIFVIGKDDFSLDQEDIDLFFELVDRELIITV